MGSSPLIKSTVTGIIMQALMVVIGKYVPSIGTIPNFYAICGTVLATLTGSMVGRSAPGAGTGATAGEGAIAGGISSTIGGMLAVATGQWPGFQLVQMLLPAISGALGGGVGGLLGRMLSKGK